MPYKVTISEMQESLKWLDEEYKGRNKPGQRSEVRETRQETYYHYTNDLPLLEDADILRKFQEAKAMVLPGPGPNPSRRKRRP